MKTEVSNSEIELLFVKFDVLATEIVQIVLLSAVWRQVVW